MPDRSDFPCPTDAQIVPVLHASQLEERRRKKLRAALDETRPRAFYGTLSLPFTAGEHRHIAVTILDDRGIQSLKVENVETAP